MAVYNSLKDLPELKNSVLTIGTFDGVHIGHQKLFEILNNKALATNSESVVITFNPHPQHIIGKGLNPKRLLTGIEEKVSQIKKMGVNHVFVLPFDEAFSKMSAKDFLMEIIIKHFNPNTIIVGHDHHFGYKKEGDIEFLISNKIKFGFEVEELKAYYFEDKIISSTWIRDLIETQNMEKVNLLLGRKFSIMGTVTEGSGRGQLLGFPTANLKIADPLIQTPQLGVYLVKVLLDNDIFFGVCNVGYRPTFDSQKKKIIEVHLFIKDQLNFYGKELKVEFNQFIRNEEKFESKEELIDQIKKDKRICHKILEDQGMKKGDSFLYVNH